MNYKSIILTVWFFLGFSIQGCLEKEDEFGCGCDVEKPFFNITGLNAYNAKHYGIYYGDEEEISRKYNLGVQIEFEHKLVSQLKTGNHFNYSLMNKSYACSCIEPGDNGSKNEKWKTLNFISIHDYNDNYQANDTLNDILEVNTIAYYDVLQLWNQEDVTPRVRSQSYFLRLLEKPSKETTNFSVKVVVELTNGEKYQTQTSPIFFRN